MGNERTKTANYRKCILTDGNNKGADGGKTLQELIETAQEKVKRPWIRPLTASGSAKELLTYLIKKNSCICGELAFFEAGKKIPLVDTEGDGSTFQETIDPKDSKGNLRKFHEQSLYFCVRENHVAIIQSPTLSIERLEDFLTWFIQTKGGLAGNAFLELQNLPAKSALNKLKDHKIRGIKFGEKLFANVKEERKPAIGAAPAKRKRYIRRIETNPWALKCLLGLGVEQALIDNIAKSGDPASIHVDVEISYRSRSEKDGVSVLNALAGTFGKQDAIDTEIRLEGKSIIKGDELSIRGTVDIQCPDGCVSMDDALSKLSRWLMEQVKSGKLS